MELIYTTDKFAVELFRSAFGGTKFRKIRLQEFRGPMSLNSYWSSGYRDYFKIVRIADGANLADVPQNGTPFDGKNFELSELPAGYAVAVHSYCGVRQYGALYLNAANLTPLLPVAAVACGTVAA